MSLRGLVIIAFVSVACGGAQSGGAGSGACPKGVIENQTQADMAVDMANRMCGAAPEGDEGATGMNVDGSAAGGTSRTPDIEGVICTSFGEAAETGRCGYPRDVASARRYYANACAKHYQPACNALARLGQR